LCKKCFIQDNFEFIFSGKEELTLEPNRYRYPFTFKLREGLPTSYEGKYGRIRYSVDSTVDIPWARDKRTKKPFTLLNCVDLNRYHEIKVICWIQSRPQILFFPQVSQISASRPTRLLVRRFGIALLYPRLN
jgi:hypothetical protein